MKLISLTLAAFLLSASSAFAQTTLTSVTFGPSPDHTTFENDGTTPRVTRYELLIDRVSPNPQVQINTVNLGKPAPVAGVITLLNVPVVTNLPDGVQYLARLSAIGPSGRSAELTTPFFRALPTLPPIQPVTSATVVR
jgi:hypothetical protein